MANLSELVTTVAKVTGMDAGTVALIARHAREAGLIAMSGRGPSAASMGLTDATNLLIAVNTSKHANEVEQAVRLYSHLVPYERDAKGYRRVREGVGTLGEVIQQLIVAAALGFFPDPYPLAKGLSAQVKDDFARGKINMAVKFNISFIAAALRFASKIRGDGLPDYPPMDSAPIVLAFDFFPPVIPGPRGPFGRVRSRGSYLTLPSRGGVASRIEETIIGSRTFQEIGRLIAAEKGANRRAKD
jgi:hypothetical protein